jgi:phenylalanyl-tRNA synthetase beta chain
MFKGYVNGILSRLGIKTQNIPVTSDVFSEGIDVSVGTKWLNRSSKID